MSLPRKQDGLRLTILLALFAVMPTLLSGTAIYYLQGNEAAIFGQGWYSLVTWVLLTTFTMAFGLSPTTLVAVLTGYFFGWKGLPFIVVSYGAAAMLGLGFGRVLNHRFVGDYLANSSRFSNMINGLRHNTFTMVIFGRLSPVLPFAMMNVAFAAIKVEWRKYLAGSLLGMFPRTFAAFYTGSKIDEIWDFVQNPSWGSSRVLFILALLLISTWGLIFVFRRSIKKNIND